MKKHSLLCAVAFIALLFVLFACDEEFGQFYTVTLDLDNGSDVITTQVPAGFQYTITNQVPVKEGYEFVCWICNETEYSEGSTITVNSNLVIKARWKEGKKTPKENEVLVTFVLNGTTYAEEIVEKGKAVTEPEKNFTVPEGYTSSDYTFDGWYFNGNKFDFTTPLEENIILTATWHRNSLRVTFDADNDTQNRVETVAWGEKVTRPSDPEKDGKSFGEWYNGDTVYDFTAPVKEDITLKASWIDEGKVSLVIKYDNGTADTVETMDGGSTYILPSSPERDGYTFLAWSVDGVLCAPSMEIELTEGTIIKALWSSNETELVTVTFVYRDKEYVEKIEKGETAAEPTKGINIPERFALDGWYRGEEKFDFTKPVESDITLRAKLIQTVFSVTFNLDGKEVKVITVERGKTASEPDDVKTDEGYDLDGW